MQPGRNAGLLRQVNDIKASLGNELKGVGLLGLEIKKFWSS